MSMNPGTASTSGLSAEIKTKVQEKNEQFSENIGDDWDWLFEAIAEAVIEHIIANAKVTVSVVGLDNGAALGTDILDRISSLGVTLVPDVSLQNDSTAVPTVAPSASLSLSAPGVID